MKARDDVPAVTPPVETSRGRAGGRLLRGLLLAYFVLGTAFLLLRYVLVPNADVFRGMLAESVSESLGRPVQIGRVDAEWRGLAPSLRLSSVTIRDAQGRTALSLSRVDALLAWSSLLRGQPVFSRLSILQPELSVRREPDGRVLVAGLEMAGGDGGGFGDWLLEQSEIRIHDATLVWSDGMRTGPPLVLDRMELRLLNRSDRLRFGLVASPPAAYASTVELRGDLEAAALRARDGLRGELFVRLERADLGAWQNWVDYPVPLTGSGGARAWVELQGRGRYQGRVDLALADASTRLRPDLPELQVSRLEGTLLARRDGREMNVETRALRLESDSLQVPELNVAIRYRPQDEAQRGEGHFSARHLDIGALAALAAHLPFEPSVLKQLARHSPAGELFDLEYGWSGAEDAPESWQLSGWAEKLQIEAGEGWPGVSGISGRFEGDQSGGRFTGGGSGVALEMPEIFETARIPLDRLAFAGAWRAVADGISVSLDRTEFANRDTAGELSGSWRSTPQGPGTVDITAELSRAAGSAVWRYIPRVAGANTRNWLKAAITAGRAAPARLELKGDLARFPFAAPDSGRFLVTARVAGADLKFAPDWPAIEGIDGELRFEGKSMRIEARRARVGETKIERAVAVIPDLGNGDQGLRIDGEAAGPTQAFLDFVEHSPVAGWIRHATDEFAASGDGRLALALDLPLRHLRDSRVHGEYRFAGNEVRLFPQLPALESAAATVGFDNDGVSIKGARATLLGQPVAAVGGTEEGGRLSIQAAGTASAAALQRQTGIEVLEHVRGLAGWQASIEVEDAVATVVVKSDLFGVEAAMPAPMRKAAAERWPSELRLGIADGGGVHLWQLALGPEIQAAFARRRMPSGEWALARGGVSVNVPVRQVEGGLMAAIRMDELDLDAWRELVSAGRGGPLLAGIALQAGRLKLFGERFDGIELRGVADSGGWRGRLESEAVAGEFDWRSRDQGALKARFERLLIGDKSRVTAHGGDKTPLDGLPALDVAAERFELRGMALGSLKLDARNVTGEWMLDALEMKNAHGEISAEGRWQPGGTTELGFNAEIGDVGAYLAAIGYPEAVRQGRARLDGKLGWTGPPTELHYPTLAGHMELQVDEGQFSKLEPGVGRLLGVLSLQALPRRVSLDFRDVFSEGFMFDRIEGGVDVSEGVMQTDNLDIRGPAARIRLSGSVDLAQESQQLVVAVQPTLTESVAVGAALANSATGLINPVAGLVTYLAQKIMQDPIEKLFSYQYAVTGGWSDPQVDKLATSASPTAR